MLYNKDEVKKLRTGVDIVKNIRIKSIMDKYGESFLNRLFTSKEKEYILNRNKDFKTIAGLFAAKEAISKMIGTGIGKLSWKDIEILHNESGRPFVNISRKLRDMLNGLELEEIDISISHEDEFSIAFAIGY